MRKRSILALAAGLLLLILAACQPGAAQPNMPLILGESYLAELGYEQALLQFEQAIAAEPENPRGYLGKTDALLHLDRREEAVAALAAGEKQVERDQRRVIAELRGEAAKSAEDGYAGLAAAYERLGLAELSFALLKRVRQEFPRMEKVEAAWKRLAESLDIAAETTTEATTAETATEAPTTTTARAPAVTQKPTTATENLSGRIEISRYFSPVDSGWFNVGDEALAQSLGFHLAREEDAGKAYANSAGSAEISSLGGSVNRIKWSDPSISLYGVKPGDPYDDFVFSMESRGYHRSSNASNPNFYYLSDTWLSFEAGQSNGTISYMEVGGLKP